MATSATTSPEPEILLVSGEGGSGTAPVVLGVGLVVRGDLQVESAI